MKVIPKFLNSGKAPTKEQIEYNKRRQLFLSMNGVKVKIDGSWGPWQLKQYERLTTKDKYYNTTPLGFLSYVYDKTLGDGTTYLEDPVIVKGYSGEIKLDDRSAIRRYLDLLVHDNKTPLGYITLTILPAAAAAGTLVYGTPVLALGIRSGISLTNLLFNPTTYHGALASSYVGASGLSNFIDNPNLESGALAALGLSPMGSGLIKGATSGITNLYHANNSIGQYLRFVGGKFKYGFDAKLPTLFRRLENKPIVVNGKVLVSPLNNRFIYETGKESPLITNFTTDLPVLPNNGGDWTGRDILVMNGNTLLGKNVISTRPSDTFTFGDIISLPRNKIKIVSGNNGDITSDLAKSLYNEYNSLSPVQKALNREMFYNYDLELRNIINTNFKPPTIKDYEFMDYVFRPKYSSQVIPKISLQSEIPEVLLPAYSNAQTRTQLLSNNWRNVIYDPATYAEALFRGERGIILKNKLKK